MRLLECLFGPSSCCECLLTLIIQSSDSFIFIPGSNIGCFAVIEEMKLKWLAQVALAGWKAFEIGSIVAIAISEVLSLRPSVGFLLNMPFHNESFYQAFISWCNKIDNMKEFLAQVMKPMPGWVRKCFFVSCTGCLLLKYPELWGTSLVIESLKSMENFLNIQFCFPDPIGSIIEPTIVIVRRSVTNSFIDPADRSHHKFHISYHKLLAVVPVSMAISSLSQDNNAVVTEIYTQTLYNSETLDSNL